MATRNTPYTFGAISRRKSKIDRVPKGRPSKEHRAFGRLLLGEKFKRISFYSFTSTLARYSDDPALPLPPPEHSGPKAPPSGNYDISTNILPCIRYLAVRDIIICACSHIRQRRRRRRYVNESRQNNGECACVYVSA